MIEQFILKNGRVIHEDLSDEFFLQIFRQMNRKNKQSSEKSAKAITHSLYIMVVISRYLTPSKELIDGYEQWLNILKDSSEIDYHRLVMMVLANFKIPKKPSPTTNQQLDNSL